MRAGVTIGHRRLTRDTDRAMVGGVCAGIADFFGFNLWVMRLLFVMFIFAAMPFALIAYLVAVFLVPAESRNDVYIVERIVRRRRRRMSRHERRRADQRARRDAAEEVSRRARALEERLARIEKHVTSRRYQLDEEFRNL